MTQADLKVTQLLLVFGPFLLGVLGIWLVWKANEWPLARFAYLIAVLGSVGLCYEAFLLSLCGLGENRPQGFECHSGSGRLGLLGILAGVAVVLVLLFPLVAPVS